ncbi:hypothetical protein [Rathayibacter toxicus]|uniref:hypothetical protein n=1 Tax=Rathayibacter toxicus TaxID=145458 RepID=UPI001C05B22B|nr:hypothetical protein [Rathayibacter toxicus]QWL29454.1 hypothetical protein E2R34_00850 [Rathayibacter toxicus]QWL31542.1 hypothetical protein E2R35_00855 [Rathayibacter toxicus]QWL33634.1 hypothetical protein E2R36_00855 [Rathayibacter toxicus]QWL35769.1 hypothetical protein E2R37_00855 [Rathayibacter toxicus]QWL37858.1 hypothetical protein E2R38_00855 [Rathayibacter toxicus]
MNEETKRLRRILTVGFDGDTFTTGWTQRVVGIAGSRIHEGYILLTDPELAKEYAENHVKLPLFTEVHQFDVRPEKRGPVEVFRRRIDNSLEALLTHIRVASRPSGTQRIPLPQEPVVTPFSSGSSLPSLPRVSHLVPNTFSAEIQDVFHQDSLFGVRTYIPEDFGVIELFYAVFASSETEAAVQVGLILEEAQILLPPSVDVYPTFWSDIARGRVLFARSRTVPKGLDARSFVEQDPALRAAPDALWLN